MSFIELRSGFSELRHLPESKQRDSSALVAEKQALSVAGGDDSGNRTDSGAMAALVDKFDVIENARKTGVPQQNRKFLSFLHDPCLTLVREPLKRPLTPDGNAGATQ
ncbi:hypothetical protein, partial [Brucella intermedia]|uniref:hypothetical protein n=1 Tax=Brucella intermedia TaxID=94625 RepID=UPI001AED109B